MSVFSLPFTATGYELNGGPIGVAVRHAEALHHALMLPDWGPLPCS